MRLKLNEQVCKFEYLIDKKRERDIIHLKNKIKLLDLI